MESDLRNREGMRYAQNIQLKKLRSLRGFFVLKDQTMLKIAIQKSGRLSEKSQDLLRECGISFSSGKANKLIARAHNFPLEVLFLRDDDIPQYVADHVADIGIVGENVILEKARDLRVVQRLGFAKCRLSLAVRRSETYTDASFFQGRRIATSYPRILKGFLDQRGIRAEIEEISGSVEIAPGIGLADGVCDIVSTGSTLLMNGLREVEPILQSEALLVAGQSLEPEKQTLLDQLVFRMQAVRRAQNSKYILLNAPNDAIDRIADILPGMRSPTVLPLAQEGWSSVHSVVVEDDFWEVIDQLKQVGAEGILVIPIEKMVQ